MQWIDPPGGKPWALFAVAGASLLLNVVLIAKLAGSDSEAPAEAAAAPVSSEVIAAGDVPADALAPDAIAASDGAVSSTVSINDEPAAPAPPAGVQIVRAEVSHSLARTFQGAISDSERADVVSAVYARLFFWDLDLRRDLQKGDLVAAAYTWDGELADIPVATYTSKKLGSQLTAYRFHATGDTFPSYWDADGNEVGGRLKNSPLAEYEQVTALLKDRPSHKGMDFKTPVGTELVSPKAGTVVRVDWNTRYNGNCAEIRYSDGTLARFLHLSVTGVKAGQKVSAGQRIGETGNTGRSTAPHLHYELERSDRTIDPVEYHGTTTRSLPASDQTAFAAEVTRLDAWLADAS